MVKIDYTNNLKVKLNLFIFQLFYTLYLNYIKDAGTHQASYCMDMIVCTVYQKN